MIKDCGAEAGKSAVRMGLGVTPRVGPGNLVIFRGSLLKSRGDGRWVYGGGRKSYLAWNGGRGVPNDHRMVESYLECDSLPTNHDRIPWKGPNEKRNWRETGTLGGSKLWSDIVSNAIANDGMLPCYRSSGHTRGSLVGKHR